ncbi:helix-turn-helix transcriptional regulator [Dactylosporangium sp. CA-092794]|uniref:helix-turn-helix transcriptional regulator n=1 Tax=Dactylosporangium sp. CA-092794 TaxID=3239929 RepID=UPI003D8E075F
MTRAAGGEHVVGAAREYRPARLVGRRAELIRLGALVEAAGAGPARTVEIAGDPGIGKTRLLAELGDGARRSGWLVLRGRAGELERNAPFSIIGDALEPHLDGPLPAIADPHTALITERYQLHRAVRTLLEELSRPAGLLLVLDDLHWADDGSAEIVEYLLRHPPHGRVLLAVAHRPRQIAHRLRHALARAARDGGVERMELGPLTPAEAGRLLPAGLGADHRQRLYAASGGNPFYLEALAAWGEAESGPAAAALDSAIRAAGVPEPVRSALVAEFVALDPDQRRTAWGAAVAGDGVDADLIARTAGLDLAGALTALDVLVRHDLLRERPVGGRFEFRHPLVRRIAYDLAGAGWRIAAHARAAAALTEWGAPNAEVVHHLERSAKRGDAHAIEALREAAAASLFAAPAAAGHWLQAALRLVPDTPESLLVRLDLLSLRARAAALVGRLEDSRARLHELRRLLPAELVEQHAQIAGFCALIERLIGRHEEAHAQLLAELAALPDQDGVAARLLKLGLAAGAVMRADPEADRDWPAEALATARLHPDPAPVAAALAMCVMAEHMADRVDAGTAARLDEATAIIDALPDGALAETVELVGFLCAAEINQERLPSAIRHLERARRVAGSSGQSHVVAFLHMMLGTANLLLGRLDRATACFDDELDAAYLTGSTAQRSNALRDQCLLAVMAGDTEEAVRLGKEALACADEGRHANAGVAAGALGIAYHHAGDPAACIELILTGGGGPRLWRVDGIERNNWYETLAAAEAALGRPEAAAGWADRAFAHAAGLPRRTGLAHLARTHALLPTDPAAAATEALHAVRLLHEAGDRLMAARAHLSAATAYGTAGDLDSARRHFTEAGALYEACGAPAQAALVLRERRRMDARQPRPAPATTAGGQPADALTPRERQVAELAARGLTNRQIGEALYLSPRTVNIHMTRIFAKLGVSRRAAVADRLGKPA